MVKELTVNLSKKAAVNFSSTMLSASITMSVEDPLALSETFKEAWSIVKEEIARQEQAMRTETELHEAIDESVDASQNFEKEMNQDVVSLSICPIHKIPFVLHPAGVSKLGKGYPAFWHCPGRNQDGSFCKEHPSK